MIDPPYFSIIWQDWFDYDPNDNGGNHPFSTVKLKVFNEQLHLGVYNNKWQWDYDYFNPYDPTDPEDTEHRHPENELTGAVAIDMGKPYRITIIVDNGDTLQSGTTTVYVNGYFISHQKYQTRPDNYVRDGAVQIGMYWNKEYNQEVNGCAEVTGQLEYICKSNQVTIEDFRVFERINL